MRQIFGEYQILDILPKIRSELPVGKICLQNMAINCKSVRIKLFANNDCECVCCGNRPDKVVLELLDPISEVPHLNFYGKRDDGSELLFTKDHILPKVLSGSDAIFNMQIMCVDCNSSKGYKIQIWDIPAIIKQIIKGQASIKRIILSRKSK